jgi:hypothetical protein
MKDLQKIIGAAIFELALFLGLLHLALSEGTWVGAIAATCAITLRIKVVAERAVAYGALRAPARQSRGS